MKNASDITLTLLGDDFDSYRLTAQTDRGREFIRVYVPGNTADSTLPAQEARSITQKAQRCSLAVRIE